jgi:hypothetical protein
MLLRTNLREVVITKLAHTSFDVHPSQVDPPHLPLRQNAVLPITTVPYGELAMPAIEEKFEFTFEELRAAGDAMGERHDCAVIATCVVTGYAYPRIHEMYRVLGRRRKCATPWVYTIGVLAQMGLKLHDISKFYDGASIRSIVPQLPEQGNFFIRSRKHVSAVRKGVCYDWAEDRKLYVKGIYQIVDLDEPANLSPPPKPKRKVFIDYSQPTKAVWAIADILFESEKKPDPAIHSNPDLHSSKLTVHPGLPLHAGPSRRYWSTFRAKVVAECVNNGINKTTAAVQVGKWMTAQGLHHRFMT